MERYIFDDKPRKGLKAFIADLVRPLRNLLRRITRKQCLYFISEPHGAVEKDRRFVQIETWPDFYAFARERELPVYRWQYDRFKQDNTVTFVALATYESVLSYGWVTVKDRSLVEGHDIEGAPILFDFETPLEHRRKGYYTLLLKQLRCLMGGIIYALSSNEPSLRAIRAAGFVQYWPEVKQK